jgi:hypothetical protein
MTYISRYAYKAVLGLCLEDDTDGDEQPRQKPTFSVEWIEAGANTFLKTGTISSLEQKYFIPEHTKAQIYILAKELKEDILKRKEAEQNEQINEPANN